jgi:hypothetical protein
VQRFQKAGQAVDGKHPQVGKSAQHQITAQQRPKACPHYFQSPSGYTVDKKSLHAFILSAGSSIYEWYKLPVWEQTYQILFEIFLAITTDGFIKLLTILLSKKGDRGTVLPGRHGRLLGK